MPKEILRLPDGFIGITLRVNEWLKPSLWSSGGRLAGRCLGLNRWEIECRCCPACLEGVDEVVE